MTVIPATGEPWEYDVAERDEDGSIVAEAWPPVGRQIPPSECQGHIDALRSALLALAYYDEKDRPCWCSHAAASGGMRHGPPCRDARKAVEDAS